MQTDKQTDFANQGDTISRQAVINSFRYDDDGTAWDVDDIVYRLEQFPSAQPEQRWIPCSERLPEEDGQYIITVKYKHVDGYDDIYTEHGEWCDGKWDMFSFGHCGEVESILAWKPLEEPWKGEQQ